MITLQQSKRKKNLKMFEHATARIEKIEKRLKTLQKFLAGSAQGIEKRVETSA